MKARFVAVMATALVSGVSSPIASANQLPGAMVTGHITSISGTEWINVDGHSYRIASSSAAASAVSKLAPGQLVDVQLTGPANSSASEVVNVVLHSGQ